MSERIIQRLSKGGPLNRVWLMHSAIGALTFGLFSIPSSGSAVVLIPMFFVAGCLIFYGALFAKNHNGHPNGRKIIIAGLALMAVASWTRAIALWGLSQGGAGSNILATLVWVWIAVGLVMLLISTWTRGVE